jgi:hypothetical protein
MKQPFIKFYVRDWQADSELRMCSLEARGLWIELICIMHTAKRRGYLETPQGLPLDDVQTSRLIGVDKGDLYRCKEELILHGVVSVEEETGLIYCRRMIKEESKARKCSASGKRGGGNPALTLKLDNQIPDTRYHISLKDTFIGGENKFYERFCEIHDECANVTEMNFINALRAQGVYGNAAVVEKSLEAFSRHCAGIQTFRPQTPLAKFENYLSRTFGEGVDAKTAVGESGEVLIRRAKI